MNGEDFIEIEARDRQLEKGSHPSTWDVQRCSVCGCRPVNFKGERLCACGLPVGVEKR